MTDGALLGSMRIVNPEPTIVASEAMGSATRLKAGLGSPSSSAQGFAIFLSRMLTFVSTGVAELRDGQRQESAPSASGNQPGPTNPTPDSATDAARNSPGRLENAAPAAHPLTGRAQRLSVRDAGSGHEAALASKTHGSPSPSDHAQLGARALNAQGSSAGPSPTPGIAPELLPTPVLLPAAPRDRPAPGRAESSYQFLNGLNSRPNSPASNRSEEIGRETTSPQGLALEGASRNGLLLNGSEGSNSLEQPALEGGLSHHAPEGFPVESQSPTNGELTSSSARERSSAAQQGSQDAGHSTAQEDIRQIGNPVTTAETAAPPSANPNAGRSQTDERKHFKTSAKGLEAGGASLTTGMGAATGVGTNATAPHAGSFQAAPRASAQVETQQGFDRSDAFKSLDMEGEHPSNPSVRWVHAGAQQAEAGFEDPALGWVSVRANGGGAGVHPALIPSSVEAAQVLAGHLAGLNSFLANRAQGVGDVTIASPESGAPGMGTQTGSGHGSGGHQGENASPQAGSSIALDAAAERRFGNVTSRQQEPALDNGASAGTLPESGAAYISVTV